MFWFAAIKRYLYVIKFVCLEILCLLHIFLINGQIFYLCEYYDPFMLCDCEIKKPKYGKIIRLNFTLNMVETEDQNFLLM